MGPVRRLSLVSALVALVTAGLATFTGLNPFHLVWAAPATAVLVGLTIVALTVAACAAVRGRLARILLGILGAIVTLAWCGAAVFGLTFDGPERVVSGVDDGDYHLVVVQGTVFGEPVYSVRLRRGSGLLAQESLVWQGLAEGSAPGQVRFTGPATDRQIEVVAGQGCGYRSRFAAATLAVDPVHRPLRLDGC